MEHITLNEAAEKWGIKADTIIKYIVEGVIDNIVIENNTIMLPDINKPHYIGKRKADTYHGILKAVRASEHFDWLLAKEEKRTFKAKLTALIESGYLLNVSNDDDLASVKGLALGIEGEKALKKKRFSINVTINNQIGLVNIGG